MRNISQTPKSVFTGLVLAITVSACGNADEALRLAAQDLQVAGRMMPSRLEDVVAAYLDAITARPMQVAEVH